MIVDKSLADLRPGQSGVVVSVAGERPFRRRLLEMGLTPGIEVQVAAVAPLGDPLEIRLRHGRLSVRKVEARQVVVR